jgi:hypothetical protein
MNDPSGPNFFVIGVVKGGSTSLYHYLDQHPEIYLPPIKETNHFAKADVRHEDFLPEYATDVRLDLDAYFKNGMPEKIHIAHVDSDAHYHALFSKVNQETAIGDVSNSYMVCPSSAQAIKEYDSDAKMIVILRNPIHRIWSQYLMNLREAKTSGKDLIQELESDAARDKTGWGVSHLYLELGKYDEQLARYYALFPKENIKVIFYESYRDNPVETLREICTFLDVNAYYSFDFSSKKNTASLPRFEKLNRLMVASGLIKTLKGLVPRSMRSSLSKVLYSDKDLPTMSLREKNYLISYYQKHVEDLGKLIDQDPRKYWPIFK